MKAGWVAKTVGDCCEVISGQSPEGKFYNTEGKGLPFYQGKKEFGEKFIQPASTWTEQTTKVAEQGDILMSVRAPVGPINFANETICIGRGLAAIRCSEQLDRDYLFYQLLHLQPEIAGREGAVFASINKTEISELSIAVAPMSEQKRIVALLDEAFADIATAKANAEKNLQNARALFESYLNKVFTERGDGFEETTLGKVCEFVGGSQPPKAVFEKEHTAGNIRLIQIRDYKSDKHIVYIPKSMAKRICSAADVMIGRYGPPLFQILRGIEGAYNVALMKTVPDESKLLRAYLYYFLKHTDILQYVIYHSERAAGQIGVTKETLEPYPIALPSVASQEEVVATIQNIEAKTQRLESIYRQKMSALDELKKSLLHQAFSGAL